MFDYKREFNFKIAQLEVDGWAVYTTESEFQALKTAIEKDNNEHANHWYSLRKRNGCICETYIIK